MENKKKTIKILLVVIIVVALALQSLYWPVHVEHESLLKKFIWVINR